MIRRSFLHWKIEITIKILKPRKKMFERKEVVIGQIEMNELIHEIQIIHKNEVAAVQHLPVVVTTITEIGKWRLRINYLVIEEGKMRAIKCHSEEVVGAMPITKIEILEIAPPVIRQEALDEGAVTSQM